MSQVETIPVAAVLECPICDLPYVLRVCKVIEPMTGITNEVYAFFRDCDRPRACMKAMDEMGIGTRVRHNEDDEIVRLPIKSKSWEPMSAHDEGTTDERNRIAENR